jgi:hypothetical protein
MSKVKQNSMAMSRAYKSRSGVREKSDKVNWQELSRLADEGLRRVEAKYGRYVEPSRIMVRARDCA